MTIQQHPATKQTFFTPENAQYGADLATKETGFNHRVIELDGGAYAVAIDNAIPAQAESDNAPQLPTIPTISLADMMARNYVANWLIDGLIEQSDLGLIFGASGGGKSFVVLDMAYCIAAGIPYHGRATKKTGVLYVCGEGHSGLQKRIKAIHIDKGCAELPNIHITTVPAAFIDENSAIAIQNTIKAIGNIGVVFVDTFHRNLGNGDENSAKDIAKFLQNIDLYLRSIGVAVIPVHHSGNDSTSGRSRGSSSIRAAMDVEYEVKKDADSEVITVTNTKMKNFEQPKPFSFKFKPVAESVVLEPTDYIKTPAKKSLSNLAKALNLPIPNFCIAYADKRLIDIFDKDFGHGEVFASECIEFANEFDYQSFIDTNLQRDILLFDLWIENEDRTLNEAHSGNPNLLWAQNQLYVIDHNLAFEDDFNHADFWQTHVFREWQFEINERSQFEQRLQNALLDWQKWWADVPESWKEANHNFE
ncbi:MAG: HipA family kinase [Methylococcaceae bacterium]